MPDENDTPKTEANSIIDPKYRDRYKEPDWLGEQINGACYEQTTKDVEVPIKDPDTGEDTGKTETQTKTVGKPKLNLDSFFGLCQENKIDTADMEAQRDRKNAAGRIRMTLGNSLRANVKKRHGLYVNGEWVGAPAEYLGSIGAPDEPTETRDGEKIKPPAPASEETADAA
jgi:hypothetical protein